MRPSPHSKLCKFVDTWKGKRKKLILMPRGSFKSSLVTIGYSLHEILRDPNIRILIDGETFNNARKFLREIKGHIEYGSVFREKFGDLVKSEPPGWTDSEIIIRTRTKNLKEPTITTSGIDVVKVGMHYDLIICDDLVSQLNITTRDQLDKVIDHYKLILSLLEPKGRLIIIGTPWDFSDLYGYVQKYEMAGFDFHKMSAVLTPGKPLEECFKKDLLFPERLSKEFLIEQRNSQGSYIFSAQYLCNPVPDEAATFKKGWFKWYDSPDEIPKDVLHFTTIDPAISQEKHAHYTVILTIAVDKFNNWWIEPYTREKLDPLEIVESIFQTHRRYKPMRMGLEVVAFQKSLQYFIKDEMKKRGNYLPLKELKTDTRISKEMRIRGLVPRFEQRMIYIRRDMKELEYELTRFPKSETDDLVDALAYMLQIAYPPTAQEETTNQADVSDLFDSVGRKKKTWSGYSYG